ncbi:MAG TPA: ATP-dependent DNA helicase RecG, partial [Azospirillaceae bacterium]|nr:ATP-dependent DNA helicase RecG [Azospirillaceae bacterium]
MRPPILYPLFAPVGSLPGLGPKLAKLAERLAGPHVVDLLWHLPCGLIDRRFAPKIAEAPNGMVATLTVRVDGHAAPLSPRHPYRVRCSDETGVIDLVFFHARGDYLHKILPEGEMVVVSGKVERFRDTPQMSHPDHIAPVEARSEMETVEPVYPLTTGLTPKVLRRAILAALKATPEMPEWQDAAWLARKEWPAWRDALTAAHSPEDQIALQGDQPARERLAFDELLANQLALALVRLHQKRLGGRAVAGDGRLRKAVIESLPFALTGSQQQSLKEIELDMALEKRMLRLLQGDVGSGKTVVALLSMLNAVEAGHQAALMAPTEILARQHLETLAPLLLPAGVSLALLTGRDKGKARASVLERLGDGRIDIVVGTHALFQEGVEFRDLALAVIDEQHRFGVHQRLQLSSKGKGVDVLVMTATPIPRTLVLTAYGDMDVSRLTEKPAGRKPIDTRTISLERLDEVIDGVRRKIQEGARVYWVCPLVEESEVSDLAAATQRQALLAERLGNRVGLVHGR